MQTAVVRGSTRLTQNPIVTDVWRYNPNEMDAYETFSVALNQLTSCLWRLCSKSESAKRSGQTKEC